MIGLFATKQVIEKYQGTIRSGNDGERSSLTFNMHLKSMQIVPEIIEVETTISNLPSQQIASAARNL
jgi:hypothetical protein